MADNVIDAIVPILRDIQATQAQHTRLLEEHSRRFQHLDSELSEVRLELTYALGLGTRSIVKHKDQEARLNELSTKVKELMDKP